MATPRPEFRSSGVLREAVELWGRQLSLDLDRARETLKHRGELGSLNERSFRDFLRAYLSPKFRVGTGEIIDAHGQRSKQVDVAIADEEQPFRVDDSAELLIIEGVVAAGEVKTTLTVNELKDCIAKGREFKKLQAILGAFWSLAGHIKLDGTRNADFFRYYKRRPFFVFAYETQVADSTMAELLTASDEAEEVPSIDAVFLLGRGAWLNFWDGTGNLSFRSHSSNEPATGWFFLESAETVLTTLLLWLHSSMPRFGMRSSPLPAYLFPGLFIPDMLLSVPGQLMPSHTLDSERVDTPTSGHSQDDLGVSIDKD